jgi:hypothetical protein
LRVWVYVVVKGRDPEINQRRSRVDDFGFWPGIPGQQKGVVIVVSCDEVLGSAGVVEEDAGLGGLGGDDDDRDDVPEDG